MTSIKTKQLRLVPIELKYAKELLGLWGDYEVVKYTHNPWCKTVEECEERIKGIEKIIDPLHMNNWVILREEEVIGVAGVPTISHEKGEYAIYYQICQKEWGKGYGFEVAKALVEELFQNTKANLLIADVAIANAGSMRILEKLGMERTHLEQDGFKRDDLVEDVMNYKLTREVWER